MADIATFCRQTAALGRRVVRFDFLRSVVDTMQTGSDARHNPTWETITDMGSQRTHLIARSVLKIQVGLPYNHGLDNGR